MHDWHLWPSINVHHVHRISSEYEEGEGIQWVHIVCIRIWMCQVDLPATRWKDGNDHTPRSGAFAGVIQPHLTVWDHGEGCQSRTGKLLRVILYNCHGKQIATAPQVDGLFFLDRVLDWALESTTYTDMDDSCLLALRTTGHASRNDAEKRMLWLLRLAQVGLKALEILLTITDAPRMTSKCDCKSCIKCKLARKPFAPTTSRATEPLQLMYSDICGPLETAIRVGRYMVFFIDDTTRHTDEYRLKYKSEALVKFKGWKALREMESGKQVKRFRTDGGSEYTSKKFAEYLKSDGISKETTTPYTPQSNVVVERANRTIGECVRCMLDVAGLPKEYWAFAVSVAVYLTHCTPTGLVVGKTLYEAWHGRKPSLKHIHVFGCLAFVHVPNEKRKKLDYRATPGIFVGYSISTKQYFVYNPLARTLHRTRDMVFREGKRYTAPNAADEAILNEHFYRDVIEEPEPTPNKNQSETSQPIKKQPTGDGNSERHTEEPLDDKSPPKPKKKSLELAGLETSLGDAWKLPAKGSRRNHAGKDTLPQSVQLALNDEEFEDMIPIYAAAAIFNNHDHEEGIDDPKSYKAASESPLSDKWHTAMKEELDAMGQLQVFGNFVKLPQGRKALPSHWVYKIKRDGAGNVQRFKAMLVCGENHHIEGIDYQAMHAPTARLGHVRLALAIAPKYYLEIHQMDVCTAFLGVNLEEEIDMHPPQGYYRLVQTGRLTKTSRKMVLRLRKSLHGLKQCSHIRYGTLNDFVILIGFVASHVDRGLFVLHEQEHHGIVVAAVFLYVDDLLIIANEGLIGRITDQMKERFRMHDLGSVSFYLGMNIERNWEPHTIGIHQHSFIRTILAKFRIDEYRPVATPMAMKLYKRKPDEEACDPIINQLMIGRLMYAMTATRPDIVYAIGVLSWYNHDPSNEHMVAFKHVFRYLNGTKDWRLRFGAALGGEGESALGCYVDSDYAGCPHDYESTSGLVINSRGAVDWRLRKQKSTAQSTTDAQKYAFGVSCIRLTQISHVLNELGIPTIPHMISDSQSVIASIKSRIYPGTAVAHIATKYYLAADMARDGDIDLSYVPTAEMLADCFPKPLPTPAFLKQCAAMGMLGIGLGNGLGNGLGKLRNGRRNGIGIGMAIGNGIGTAIGKQIDWLGTFVSRRSTMFDWLLISFVYCFCLKRTW